MKKRIRLKNCKPSYYKALKIKKNIDEMNTIEGIELYEDLYKLYSKLFFETYSNKLACLNYYTDVEYENGLPITVYTAEIKDTWELSIPQRYKLHQELLERVMSHDITLIHCNSEVQIEDNGQLSLFA